MKNMGFQLSSEKHGCGLERWGKNDRQYEFDIEKVRKIKGNVKKEKIKRVGWSQWGNSYSTLVKQFIFKFAVLNYGNIKDI